MRLDFDSISVKPWLYRSGLALSYRFIVCWDGGANRVFESPDGQKCGGTMFVCLFFWEYTLVMLADYLTYP